MDANFWISAWKEGRTGFHQAEFNEKLLKYFPLFNAKADQKVLVPLCGKTKDLLWLCHEKLQVHGIELYEEALKDFFSENQLLMPEPILEKTFKQWTLENLTLSCGDFFKLEEGHQYDYVYDRASLVALPSEMRVRYVEKIKNVLKPGGKYLLISYEYNESQMQSPPFSVTEEEIRRHYEASFKIELMEREPPQNDNKRLDAVTSLRQTVFILRKM